jgi:hypothetical protein
MNNPRLIEALSNTSSLELFELSTIMRINQHTATVDTGGGHSWQMSFALLRQVIDVSRSRHCQGRGSSDNYFQRLPENRSSQQARSMRRQLSRIKHNEI